ncbi:MAG: hypothetical protein E6K49_11810 [Gammaproteobacteria bacterium]|nr:MAG: hypothetical protein E6K49_11810 [Gammaproteobacteria bacterium]
MRPKGVERVRPDTNQPVSIVGAGLAGALLAVLLARRRFSVRLYDRRLDPRLGNTERGRSINLALAARGIRALERAGVMERVGSARTKSSTRSAGQRSTAC